jgi:hypothetical protein
MDWSTRGVFSSNVIKESVAGLKTFAVQSIYYALCEVNICSDRSPILLDRF